MMIQPATSFGETGLSDNKDMKIEITKEPSSDYGHGYYVEYTINGIPYRSDITGSRINQMAYTHMSDEQKATVIRTYGVVAIEQRKNNFGEIFSGEMTDWYNEYSGWKKARQILADRLAEKNFPQFQKVFKNSSDYFKKNFEPNCNYFFFDETDKLYEEEKVVFSYAKAAYQSMVKVQSFQTSNAVKSLSGDLIQLIVDRALVPNITPSGMGGIAASINGTIADYVTNIMHTNDQLQEMVIGKRVSGADAREIIDKLSDTLLHNERIINVCFKELRRLKGEIESKYEQLEAEYEEKVNTLIDEADAESDAVINASPVDGAPNADIVATINYYDQRIKLEPRNADALKAERLNYIQQQYTSAMSEFQEWCTLYFGGPDPRKSEEGSVIHNYYANYPALPQASYGDFDLYMTADQAKKWEEGARNYALQSRDCYEKRILMKQEAYKNATEARKKYNDLAGRINALYSVAGDEFWPQGSIMPYGTGEWAHLTIRDSYLSEINEYAGIYEEGHYKKYLESELSETDTGDRGIAFRRAYDNAKGTIAHSQDKIKYYQSDFILEIESQMDRLAQFHNDVDDEIEDYKALCQEYVDSYNDFVALIDKRNDFIDEMPEYIRDKEASERYLGDLFWADEILGTPEDVLRIGEETDRLLKQSELFNAQLEITEHELMLNSDKVANMSTYLSERIAYYNQELTEDVDFWYDHQGYKDSGKKGLKTTLKVCASEDNEKFGPEALQAIRKAYTDYGTSDETLREERKDAAERLEWLGHDFNGKTWAHEQYMEIFGDLCDNKEKYKTTESDDYENLKIRLAEIKPTDDSYAAYVLEKPGEAASWPDPYEDLVKPLIREIDEARQGEGTESILINEDNLTLSGMEPKKTYTGFPQEQDITLSVDGEELIPDTDYEILYEDNENVGTAKMTITGKGRYAGTVEKTFVIVPVSLVGVQAEVLADRIYTGKAITVVPKLYVDKITLVNNKDYTYKCKNNRNVGTATVKITGKGNYTGNIALTFKIYPKKSNISKLTAKKKGLTVKWSKISEQATGYKVQIATNSAFTKGRKTYKITKNKTTSKTISKLKAKKEYYVRIRTYMNVKENGKTVPYYSEWSKVKHVRTK